MEILSQIREADLDVLRDQDRLTKIILSLGLFFPDRAKHVPESWWGRCNRGLHIWQGPEQFADYLIHLSTRKIGSYLEIGCGAGGTFATTVEYLRRFNGDVEAFALDNYQMAVTKAKAHIIKDYVAFNKNARFVPCDRADLFKYVKERVFDHVFIDADHTYRSARADWEFIRPYAKSVGFHDIRTFPGVAILWQLIKQRHPEYTYKEFCRVPETDFHQHSMTAAENEYLRIFGIGLVELKISTDFG